MTTRVKATARQPRASRVGMVLAAATLLFAASGLEQFRIGIGPLALHPYLLVLGPLFVVVVLPRLRAQALSIMAPFLTFIAVYTLASLTSGGAGSELIKLSASVAVFLTAHACIRNVADLRLACIALVGGMALLAVRGLLAGDTGLVGINPMEGVANKNAFGAYAAPALVCAGLVLLRKIPAVRWQRAIVGVGALLIVGAIFSTASRASWGIALMVVVFWLAQDRSPRAVVFLGMLALGTFFVLSNFTSTAVIEHRLNQTTQGTTSDEARQGLVGAAFEIALENPIIGIGVQPMWRELARRIKSRRRAINAHNVYAHIVASSGFPALLLFLWGIVRLVMSRGRTISAEARRFSYLAAGIFLFEGMFTHEVLYIPSMWLLLGIAYRLREASQPQTHRATPRPQFADIGPRLAAPQT